MGGNGVSLEVVRGREAGRVYALGRGATVLGNALDGAHGLDLAEQEGESPRKMAARQAELDLSDQALTVRDLDSPGGTFVNRQRLLPGQARALQPGDLIQLGGVQLKVVSRPALKPASAPMPAPAPAVKSATASKPAAPARRPEHTPNPTATATATTRTGPLPAAFTLASGARCRTWDDFLTVSAQRWPSMRDELVSGRLAGFLASVGRADLAPSAMAPGTPDERLDAWLGTLPTTRPSRPELEVHPATLKLRAVPGGGMLRASVQITNTGYRLLRTKARVEPASASWVKLADAFASGPIVTVDQTDLPVEVHIPDAFDATTTAAIVLDSNGGTRRVEIRLERPAAPDAIPEVTASPSVPVGPGLHALLARQPLWLRLVTWSAGAMLLRVLVLLTSLVVGVTADEASPALRGVAVPMALLGSVAAMGFALKHGEPPDVPPSAFAGGVAGVLVATVIVAACRTFEPVLGSGLVASPIAVCLLWGATGAALAGASAVLAPPHPDPEASP